MAATKASRYNVFVDDGDGGLLAFNASTAALLRIRSESRAVVERLLEDPESAEGEEELRYAGILREKRFLVEEGEDEVERLEASSRESRGSDEPLQLTIAPTLACNFRCDYCYERPAEERMTPAVEQALLDFVDRREPGEGGILVTWFGGEPTLCVETIERIQKGLRAVAARHASRLHPSGIVTNGWLLDRRMATRLRAAGVHSAQVTLDGPREVHDARRRLASGRGTFDAILANVEAAASLLQLTVRVNVDGRNADSAAAVVEELRGRGLEGRVRVYFAPVESSRGACADVRDRCLSAEEFSRFRVDLYRRLVAGGFRQVAYPSVSFPTACSATRERSFVVAPSGALFKCWEEISDGMRGTVGTVLADPPDEDQRARLGRWLAWDAFSRAECRECRLLPLCMGGCPNEAMREGGGTSACSPWKYDLEPMLRLRGQAGPAGPEGR